MIQFEGPEANRLQMRLYLEPLDVGMLGHATVQGTKLTDIGIKKVFDTRYST